MGLRRLRESVIQRTQVRLVLLLVGIVYLLLGISGTVSSFETTDYEYVLFFSSSSMNNTIHLATGALAMFVAWKPANLGAFGLLVFFAYAGLTGYGVASTVSVSPTDTITVTWADNILHAITSAIGLWLALGRRGRTAGSEESVTAGQDAR